MSSSEISRIYILANNLSFHSTYLIITYKSGERALWDGGNELYTDQVGVTIQGGHFDSIFINHIQLFKCGWLFRISNITYQIYNTPLLE